jgi:hypothetical protein
MQLPSLLLYISCLSCLLFIGCGNVAGTYVFNIDDSDTLKILSNGTYERVVEKRGEQIISRGTWQRDGRRPIYFRNWVDSNDSTNKIIKGLRIEISIFSDEIRIYSSYDQELYYKKAR